MGLILKTGLLPNCALSGWFLKRLSRNIVPNNHFLNSCFSQLLNIYLNDMQINRWLNLSRIMGNFPLHRLVQKKNRPKKFLLMAANNRNVLDVRSVKYFFAPNFPISLKDWTKRIQSVMHFTQMWRGFILSLQIVIEKSKLLDHVIKHCGSGDKMFLICHVTTCWKGCVEISYNKSPLGQV